VPRPPKSVMPASSGAMCAYPFPLRSPVLHIFLTLYIVICGPPRFPVSLDLNIILPFSMVILITCGRFPYASNPTHFLPLLIFSPLLPHNSAPLLKICNVTMVVSLTIRSLVRFFSHLACFFACHVPTPLNRMARPSTFFVPRIISSVLCSSKHTSLLLTGLRHFILLPTSSIATPPKPSISPHQALYDRPPSYTHLRVFGCCYPNTSATMPHKLAPCSTLCVFLGYSHDHKGYRCLELSSNRVIISRHVVFDETSFPFAEASSPSESLTNLNFLDEFDCHVVAPVHRPTVQVASDAPGMHAPCLAWSMDHGAAWEPLSLLGPTSAGLHGPGTPPGPPPDFPSLGPRPTGPHPGFPPPDPTGPLGPQSASSAPPTGPSPVDVVVPLAGPTSSPTRPLLRLLDLLPSTLRSLGMVRWRLAPGAGAHSMRVRPVCLACPWSLHPCRPALCACRRSTTSIACRPTRRMVSSSSCRGLPGTDFIPPRSRQPSLAPSDGG
jgi:hypothetical protein